VVQFSKGLACVGDELCSCLLHADLHLHDETGIQSIKTMRDFGSLLHWSCNFSST
jgi:hypothetical protein